MKFLRQHVVGARPRLCVISDKNKSVINIFIKPEIMDCGWNVQSKNVHHRYCARHIAQNFHKQFKNKQWLRMVKNIMRQNQLQKFNARMSAVAQLSPEAHQWLQEIGDDSVPHPELWALAHDGGRRWGMMTTNGPESLNNIFKEARELPVTSIIEVTFYKCVRYFFERRKQAVENINSNRVYSTKVTELIEKRRLKGNTHTVTGFHQDQRYEVITS